MSAKRSVWFSWNDSRRSRELAVVFGATPSILELPFGGILRQLFSGIWACIILLVRRPRIVFVQHSIFLTVLLSLYKRMQRRQTTLIVDCHTKALHRTVGPTLPRPLARLAVSALQHSDVVIVANKHLADRVAPKGMRASVLHDPPYHMPAIQRGLSGGSPYFLYVASFAIDEPWDEFLAAAADQPEHRFLCTGAPPPAISRTEIPRNVSLTGYVPDADYWKLVRGATAVLALTTRDDCLQCAGFEALSAGTPLILTHSDAQRAVFARSARYIRRDVSDLHDALRYISRDPDRARAAVLRRAHRASRVFSKQLAEVGLRIQSCAALQEP